jgi:hypothetical protein
MDFQSNYIVIIYASFITFLNALYPTLPLSSPHVFLSIHNSPQQGFLPTLPPLLVPLHHPHYLNHGLKKKVTSNATLGPYCCPVRVSKLVQILSTGTLDYIFDDSGDKIFSGVSLWPKISIQMFISCDFFF